MPLKINEIFCSKLGISPLVPNANSKLGLAIETIGKSPIIGMRVPEENGTNGWYIWCGEEVSEDENFYSPLHVEHIKSYLPQIEKYLGLPPGYRFLVDNIGYEDVWFDEGLLK